MTDPIDWKRVLYCIVQGHGGKLSTTVAEYEASPINLGTLSFEHDKHTDEIHIVTRAPADPERNYIDRPKP